MRNTKNFIRFGCFHVRSNFGKSRGRLRNSSIIGCDGNSGLCKAFFRIVSSALMANL